MFHDQSQAATRCMIDACRYIQSEQSNAGGKAVPAEGNFVGFESDKPAFKVGRQHVTVTDSLL